jgi:hypothetical protein
MPESLRTSTLRVPSKTARIDQPQVTSESFNPAQRFLLALLFVGLSALHFASAYAPGPAPNWAGKTSEYYPLLTDAFLAGRTSLLVPPDPKLLALPNPWDPTANARYRLHDASLYQGRYYLYFGPTPALVLFLPYKVLTGTYLPTRAAVALFCIGGYACSCVLFFLLARREKWVCPFWLAATAVLSLGTSSLVVFLLMRPSFYETAISSAYCFLMGGFALLAHALGQKAPRLPPLILSGLCFGLAAGCRPTAALLAVLVAALLLFRLRAQPLRVLAFGCPIVVCGLLLAWYNYARFQNPLEFGMRYSLLASATDLNDHFAHSLKNLLPSIYLLLFARAWEFGKDPAVGLLWGAPIALIGLCLPLVLRKRAVNDTVQLASTRFTLYSVYASAIAILALLAFWGFILGRYDVDFVPELVVLSWCLLAASWQAVQRSGGRRALLFRTAVCGLTLYSVVLDVGACWQRLPRL